MDKNIYAYMWFNIDTFEIFYIGIGTGDRRFNVRNRSPLFKEYYESNNCAVRIYERGLSDLEAKRLEKELIAKYNPCCNQTKGGERTDGKKISEALKGRTLSEEHKKNLSIAAKKQWENKPIMINNKQVIVFDKVTKDFYYFEAKYKVGEWLHKEFDISKNPRSAERKVRPLYKSGGAFNNRFYFIENIDNVS